MKEQLAAMCSRLQLGTIERKSLLRKTKVEYATWAVNHVARCAHDCRYCYAKSGEKAVGRIHHDDEWARPALVIGSAEMLKAELARKRQLPESIHLCFMSDPFMFDAATGAGDPEVCAATIDVIRVANAAGVPVTTLTKGVYPEGMPDDLDQRNQYGITVVSQSEEYRSAWEPGAASQAARIESLRRLSEAGARTWVSIEPYPTPNIDPTAMNPIKLLHAIEFADKIIFGRMNYVPEVTAYLKNDPCFFDRVSAVVSTWCNASGKPLHIKSGTPGHRADTAHLLRP